MSFVPMFLSVTICMQCSCNEFSFIPLTEPKWESEIKRLGIYGPTFESRNLPTILNLNDILYYFGKQNCAIHVDNIFNVPLDNFVFPIYLRKPVLALLEESWGNYPVFAWLDFSKANNSSHASPLEIHPINVSHISVRTRPWNCEVQVLLYPPLEIILNPQIPFLPSLTYPNILRDLNHQLPSLRLRITLSILDPKLQQNSDDITTGSEQDVITKMFVSKLYNSIKYFHDQVLLSATVSRVPQNSIISEMTLAKAIVGHFEIFQVCSLCHNDSRPITSQGGELRKIEINDLASVRRLAIQASPQPNDAIVWDIAGISESSPAKKSPDNALSYVTQCKSGPSFLIATAPLSIFVAERYAKARAHVFMAVMRNWTTQMKIKTYCLNGRQLPFHDNLQMGSVFAGLKRKVLPNTEINDARLRHPLVTRNVFNCLRFVSCGNRGFLDYPFHHLTNVYDPQTWVAMVLLCCVVIPIVIHISYAKPITVQFIFVSWKALLEQGDTLMQPRSPQFGFGKGLFVLGAVLLSNAYKNRNVYDMIAPQQPKPIETVDDLIQENFSIFTRIAILEL